jgi:hypothetical protein
MADATAGQELLLGGFGVRILREGRDRAEPERRQPDEQDRTTKRRTRRKGRCSQEAFSPWPLLEAGGSWAEG